MLRYLNTFTVIILGVLVAGGLGFAYEIDRLGASMTVFLGILTLALGVISPSSSWGR